MLGHKIALDNLAIIAVTLHKTEPVLGFKYFNCASKLGHLNAKRNLAYCIFQGIGTEIDVTEAIKLYKECYAAGDIESLKYICDAAIELLMPKNKKIKQDVEQAIQLIIFAAEKAHLTPYSEIIVGNLVAIANQLYNGIAPNPKDTRKAAELYNIGARFGEKEALHNLGAIAAELIKIDAKLGFEYMQSAVKFGNLNSKFDVGVCYLNGIGTERDVNKAATLFKECYTERHQKSLEAIRDVANRLFLGEDGIKQDVERAIELFIFSANTRDSKSIYDLVSVANRFYEGLAPCSKDIKKAAELWNIAAELGDKEALHNLTAVALEFTQTEPKLSFQYLTCASKLDYLQAKLNLGMCFFQGIGTEVDANKAIELFEECYAKGEIKALDGISEIAGAFFSLNHEKIKHDLEKAIALFTFGAQELDAVAIQNLYAVANQCDIGTSTCPKNSIRGAELRKKAEEFQALLVLREKQIHSHDILLLSEAAKTAAAPHQTAASSGGSVAIAPCAQTAAAPVDTSEPIAKANKPT